MDRKILSFLERLSNIKINENEIERLESSINDSLKCIDSLLSINTDGIEEFCGFFPYQSRFFADIPIDLPYRDEILQNSVCKNGFVVVPKFVH